MNPNHRTLTTARPLLTMPIIVFGVVALFLLVYYVVQANMLAADTWRLKTAQDQLISQKSARDDLTARQAQLDDRTVLQTLATAQGMVPAEHTVYLVQSDAVAAR
ncbi:MAG TPA: hypothetical protein VMU12_01490 [Candidatus Paceibacterota bacterium]|nr:hypothetical protein [Candidatus Paceibacterota bacterium]